MSDTATTEVPTAADGDGIAERIAKLEALAAELSKSVETDNARLRRENTRLRRLHRDVATILGVPVAELGERAEEHGGGMLKRLQRLERDRDVLQTCVVAASAVFKCGAEMLKESEVLHVEPDDAEG